MTFAHSAIFVRTHVTLLAFYVHLYACWQGFISLWQVL